MKKLFLVTLVIVAVVFLFLSGCGKQVTTSTPAQAPAATPVVITLDTGMPPEAITVKEGYLAWKNEVEKRSNGRIQIQMNYLNALVARPDVYEGVQAGLVDIGEIDTGSNPGVFPLFEADRNFFKFFAPNARWSQVFWDLYKAFPEAQAAVDKVKVLFIYDLGTGSLVTKKQINKLEDWKGVKMICFGENAERMYKAIGATPVTTPPPEWYTSVEKGITEGSHLARIGAIEWRIIELMNYMVGQNTAAASFPVIMNWDKWKSLPADLQKVLEETGGEFAAKIFDDAFYRFSSDEAIAKNYPNITITRLPAEEQARWEATLKPVMEQHIANLNAKGLPGQKYWDEWERLMQVYAR